MAEQPDEKERAFEELRRRLDPETLDLIAKSDPSTWTGVCYTGLNCGPPVLTGGRAVTIAGCQALGGKSWKGDWAGASCINL